MSDFTHDIQPGHSAKSKSSALDVLRKVIAKEVEKPVFGVPVPLRPEITLWFSPNITAEDLDEWRKAAGSLKKSGMDFNRFSRILIGNTNVGISVDGEDITDESGDPITIMSPEFFQGVMEEYNPDDAMRELYKNDGNIASVAAKIMEKSGWVEEVDEVDPLKSRA